MIQDMGIALPAFAGAIQLPAAEVRAHFSQSVRRVHRDVNVLDPFEIQWHMLWFQA
jgi:hypothetical protein